MGPAKHRFLEVWYYIMMGVSRSKAHFVTGSLFHACCSGSLNWQVEMKGTLNGTSWKIIEFLKGIQSLILNYAADFNELKVIITFSRRKELWAVRITFSTSWCRSFSHRCLQTLWYICDVGTRNRSFLCDQVSSHCQRTAVQEQIQDMVHQWNWGLYQEVFQREVV